MERGVGLIPIILLGQQEDANLDRALKNLLIGRCGYSGTDEFCWHQDADILLVDSPRARWIDGGSGIVLIRESFCAADAPAHLMHAQCIVFPGNVPAACKYAADSGLPAISCGGHFDTLTLSSMKEQTVFTLQKDIQRLDGTEVLAGDFPIELPSFLTTYEMLGCAAIRLLLGD